MPDSVLEVTAPIVCPRLDLVSLDLATLSAIEAGNLAKAQGLIGFEITDEWAATVPAWRRAGQIRADASVQPWLARAMVLRSEARAVGYIGCHDRPDEAGRVELGYQVLAADRRQGFAEEAVRGLLVWAVGHGATGLILSIAPDNEPSLELARRLGLEQTGEQMDEIDGLELVFERSLPLDPRSG